MSPRTFPLRDDMADSVSAWDLRDMLPILILGLALFHAIRESAAFASAAGSANADAFDRDVIDATWIAGAASFVGFELFVMWRSISALHLAPASVIGALAGTTLFLLGTRLRCKTIATLSQGFGKPPFDHRPTKLFTSGVFALVRHPSELGLLLMGAGLFLVAGDQQVLFVLVCLVPLGALRIYREESWLRQCFGPVHADYRHEVPMILPTKASYRTLS
jgi:protein-S-isoprenylcysteine O-methyltransferase Ste14